MKTKIYRRDSKFTTKTELLFLIQLKERFGFDKNNKNYYDSHCYPLPRLLYPFINESNGECFFSEFKTKRTDSY